MRRAIIVAILIPLAAAGCASAEAKSPMQLRQIQSRTVEGNYENVFRSTMTVLRDNNYTIKNTDMASGLITAEVDREASMGSQFMQALFVGTVYHKNTFIEVSATIDKINETTQELRMNIQETQMNAQGGRNAIGQITNPEVYQKLFNDILVETRRREAMGRGEQ